MALTFLNEEKKKTPFESTTAGLALETVRGLPRAAVDVSKDIGRGMAPNI